MLFINLERPRQTLLRRDVSIREVLGVEGGSGVRYLHGKGASLSALMPIIHKFCREHPGAVLFLDSISRAGVGKLNEDITANTFVDLMGSTGATWAAIGHTPREDNSHIYGSIHFEAGEDIGVRVSSTKSDALVGISLEMTKANDMSKPKPSYYAFEFDDRGLYTIKLSTKDDLPGIGTVLSQSRTAQIVDYAKMVGLVSAPDIEEELGIFRQHAGEILRDSGRFHMVKKDGRKVLYGLKQLGGHDEN